MSLHRYPSPLPEAAPDFATWTTHLLPWLLAAGRCPRPAANLAEALAPRCDARDLTVDVAQVSCLVTSFTQCRALGVLIETGLLVPLDNGRYRIELPGRR